MPVSRLDAADFRAHFQAEFGVEIGERLVEKQDVRACGSAHGRAPRAAAGRRKAAAGRRPIRLPIWTRPAMSLDLLADIGGGRPLTFSGKPMFSATVICG